MGDDWLLEGDALVLDGPATLASARRYVAECVERLGAPEVVGDAQLVASELITNVFLHTGGPAELGVRRADRGVRVEVRDSSPVPPVRITPGGSAMTGRGLNLVEGMSARWGVTPLATGKVVWAELRDVADGALPAADLDEDELLAMWADEAFEVPAPPTVELGAVPTQLLLAAKGHVDNLVREFTLIAAEPEDGPARDAPPAVTKLIDVVVEGFAEPRQALRRLALQADAAGEDHVDVVLVVPDDIDATIAAGEQYLEALDMANAYCRAARLLTLESPPQHRVFHRWYVEEFIGHLRARRSGGTHRPTTFENRLLQEIGVVAAAHRLADRAARLHSLAVALSAALTSQAVAEAVLDEGVTAMGASGGVVLLATDSSTLGVPGAVGHDETVMARLRNEHPDAALPAAEAMRTGESVWLETPSERNERFPDLIGFEPSTVAMCAVPLVLGDRRLGALRFSFTEARLFDEEERRFVTALAAQTAQALHRAELYHARQEVAERLQATLLPSRLPTIPGIEVGATYHPLTDSLDVGGDFYDVWQCADQRWGFAIGDVAGSGPEAAAVTGLVRHTIRALTSTPLSIEDVLRRLNQALLDAADDPVGERFCTVVLGFLDLEGDGARIELASGGHPEPLVVRRDGSVESVTLAGMVLGAFEDVRVVRRELSLARGESLVLVTDGATEARSSGTMLGIEGVAAAAAGSSARAAKTVLAIEQTVRNHGGGRLRDDLAVLVLRRS